ncbi:MAG: M48 family metallopeptidase [Acidobacteriota bacterium]
MKIFSRVATTLLLVSSMLAGSVSMMAQTASKPEPDKSQVKAADKQDSKKAQQKEAAPAPATTNKALATNENPDLIGKRNINKGIIASMSGSTEKEVRMGRELATQVDREAKFVDDPVITEYINRVGQNIVLHSDAKVPFTIKVIDSDEVNAFALPGGFFYVNKGLLLAADNEAELAGVMAHEISHVAARHAVENQTKATIAQYAIMVPAIVLGGGLGQLIYQGGNFGALLGFMKFSRGAEEEADRLGIQYLYAAGYDPTAMATMFEKLESKNKKKPGTISKLFATHPAPADRRAASLALAARFPEREEYVISSSEFQKVKARLMRLSNARASTAGALPGGEEGAPGRPTLKRRQPAADDPTTTPENGEPKPVETKEAPKLKRNDGTKPTQP